MNHLDESETVLRLREKIAEWRKRSKPYDDGNGGWSYGYVEPERMSVKAVLDELEVWLAALAEPRKGGEE